MMRSLRTRLFVGLTIVIVVTGILGGGFAYLSAYDEAIEMQDAILVQVGAFASSGPFAAGPPVNGIDSEAKVDVIELSIAPHDDPDDQRLSILPDGLHTAVKAEETVRVLLGTRANGGRFAVAQRTEIRNEIAQDTAVRTLLPITALVPCLLIVTALVIAYSFKPMLRLAADLDARPPDDFGAFAAPDTPGELRPFVASINAMVDRLQAGMQQQKRFVADAAHELRTPITALSIQAENLDAMDMSHDARTRVAALQDGMRRTRLLLEQLLTLARQDAAASVASGSVRLDEVAKQVVADMLPEAVSRHVDLGFEMVEEIAVCGDTAALTSFVRNLVENAVRFTPAHGRVDLGLHHEEDSAVLRIEDSGPGIPPCDLERVLEPFFRGDHPGHDGSGLGLSIVKRIAERLNARVIFENIGEGERTGLRVLVRLPVSKA